MDPYFNITVHCTTMGPVDALLIVMTGILYSEYTLDL